MLWSSFSCSWYFGRAIPAAFSSWLHQDIYWFDHHFDWSSSALKIRWICWFHVLTHFTVLGLLGGGEGLTFLSIFHRNEDEDDHDGHDGGDEGVDYVDNDLDDSQTFTWNLLTGSLIITQSWLFASCTIATQTHIIGCSHSPIHKLECA